jgi:prepilin peptidase CpaA
MATATAPATTALPSDDSLGIDRPFLMMLARLPLIAAGFVLAAWIGHQVAPAAPTVLLCLGMIVAAVIDGWAFKVPNWLTLSLVLSGWGIGLLHDFGVAIGPGPIEPTEAALAPLGGGLGAAFLGTVIGFAMLFPALFLGGMGQGDVKMQMGFGSWVGALYGASEGGWTIVYAVCTGMIVGGVIGLAMMLLRGQLHRNLSNIKEIMTDLRLMVTAGPQAAASRAQSRRPSWHRLPYGIPLCLGFVGYLGYLYF